MKILIVTDKLIYKYKNEYYTTGGFSFQFNSFSEIFNDVELLAPTVTIEDEKFNVNNKLLVSKVYEINQKSKVRLLYHSFKLSYFLKTDSYDNIQLRLPSKVSNIFYIMNSSYKRYFTIIGGHPYKSILEGINKKIPFYLRAKVAEVNLFLTKKIMKKSKVFVTGNELFKEFIEYDPIEMVSTSVTNKEIFFEEFKKTDNDLIFVGRFTKEKNILLILEALLFLRDKKNYSVNLQLIGDGPEKQSIKDFVEKHKLESQVEFLGQVNKRKEILNKLRKSKIFILSSLTEGTPKVIIEAMSQGTPVISTSVGGISGIITHNENGILYNSNDYVSLADNIIRLMVDEDLYNEIRNKSYSYISSNTLETYIERIKSNL
ncbi:glycosyltransferase [Planococcus kocurii]|uniref:glycosyltransferase n=1 Tax=Planococcus kocurii TaxID=1374 RepID=UPI003CFE3B21